MTSAVQLDAHPAAVVGWLSLAAFGRDILGSRAKNPARAARDWCQANGVPYTLTGKVNWVRLADVRDALERIAAPPANDVVQAALARALAQGG